MFMQVSRILNALCLSPNEITRDLPIWVGTPGLRHKLRHEKSERPREVAELSGPAGRNHGDTSDGCAGHFLFFHMLFLSCDSSADRDPRSITDMRRNDQA